MKRFSSLGLIIGTMYGAPSQANLSISSSTVPQKLELLNPLPAMKRFLLTVQNQKLVIRNEGLQTFIKEGEGQGERLALSSVSGGKNEGIRFGTFVQPRTMLYVRAGLDNQFSSGNRSPWDDTILTCGVTGHALSPGIGIEWAKGPLSISGEYRASIQPYSFSASIRQNPGDATKKIKNTVVLSARYRLGKEKTLTQHKRTSFLKTQGR